jgi:hypothetical protein
MLPPQAVGSPVLPFLTEIFKKISNIIIKKKDKLYSSVLLAVRMLACLKEGLLPYMDDLPGM